jgi:outer membrane receptor protein involved in Fe transport
LKLSFGARYDYSKLDSLKGFGDFSPKLGLNYNLTQNLILRSSVGVGFRAPSLAEAFTSTVASGITIKPNPNLKPEKSLSTEIGINYRLNENINFDVAFFNNEFYDFIDPDVVVDSFGNNFAYSKYFQSKNSGL